MEKNHLDDAQFKAIDEKLGGIDGAINRLSDNVGKWLGAIAESIQGHDLDELKAAIDKADKQLKETK